jgi:WD40 repeat protein
VRIWDVESGELLHRLERHTLEVLAVSFSQDPQGSRLFTGGRDETLRVWDSESGEELLVIPTGTDIWGIAVGADGKKVATSGGDGIIRLWESERPTPTIRKRRRIVAAARQLVDERVARFSSPAEVNDSLFSDDSINAAVRQVALEILHARRGVRADSDASNDP